MSALRLERIDPARNMRRFYRLDVQPELFGGFAVIREWGRIGQAGRVRADHFDHPEAAFAAMNKLLLIKAKRGYRRRDLA